MIDIGARILLLTPNWRLARELLPTDTLRPPVSFPPEWAYVLRDALNYPEARVDVLDAYLRDLSVAALVDYLRRIQPNHVVVSSTPSYLFWRCPPLGLSSVQKSCRAVRAACPTATVWVVGPHGTSEPAHVLRSVCEADAVFRGEIDVALLRAVVTGDTTHVSTRSAVEAKVAPEADLTQACTPSSLHPYEPHAWTPAAREWLGGRTGALIEAARGCPHDCGFCYRDGFRRRLRLKPLQTLASEMDAAADAGAEYLFFIDETFGIPWRHYVDVLALASATGLPFGIQTRPELWTESRVDELREAGCVYAEVGLEALKVNAVEATDKFRDPEAAVSGAERLKLSLPFVGVNILDQGNPDLGLMSDADARSLRDNEGDRPPPFIPYPHTPWGRSALESLGGDATFGDASAAYAVYHLEKRSRALYRLLRWRPLRTAAFRLARATQGYAWPGKGGSSRFEYRERRR